LRAALGENITKLTMRFDTPGALKSVDNYGADKGVYKRLTVLRNISKQKNHCLIPGVSNVNSMEWQVSITTRKSKTTNHLRVRALSCRRFLRVLSVPSTYTKNSSAFVIFEGSVVSNGVTLEAGQGFVAGAGTAH
jgi:hypothetical protein